VIESRAPYVYRVLVDGVVKYIGKGRYKRFNNCFAKAVRESRAFGVEIVKVFSTDEEAFAEEVRLIALHRSTLWNTYDGGQGLRHLKR
jgi:hypothetical protein